MTAARGVDRLAVFEKNLAQRDIWMDPRPVAALGDRRAVTIGEPQHLCRA
jgi:hypothetical protein